jgi:hypothetical protein
VRHSCEAVEADVVAARDSRETAQRTLAQVDCLFELALESIDCGGRRVEQTRDLLERILPPRLNLPQSMPHGFDERDASAWIVEQIVLQIGIACDCPDVTQDFV